MLVEHVYSALSEEMPAGAGRAVTKALLLRTVLRPMEIVVPF